MQKNEKNELIKELEELNQLYEDMAGNQYMLDDGIDEELVEQLTRIKSEQAALKGAPSVFENMPAFYDFDRKQMDTYKAKQPKLSMIFKIILVATAIIIVVSIIKQGFSDTLMSLFFIALPAIFAAGVKSSNESNYKKQKAKLDELENKYQQSLLNFHNSLQSFEKEKAFGLESAKEYEKTYRASYEEQEEYIRKLTACKDIAQDNILQIRAKIETYDLIPQQYAYLLSEIIMLLKSGRADTLKEALNLAIEEEKAAERERARREEERRRTEIMRQQMENERRHQEEMEHQARMQTEIAREQSIQQERAAKDAKRAQEKADRDAFHADVQARNEALKRCRRCAKQAACGTNWGIPNCGAFEPKIGL